MSQHDNNRAKPGKNGLDHVQQAARFSYRGLKAAWRNEFSFRFEIYLAMLFVPAAFWLGQSALERSVLIMCAMLVLICELLNSSVEAVVDRIGTEHHALSGQAKDIGSAAVFLAMANFVVVWGFHLLQRVGWA